MSATEGRRVRPAAVAGTFYPSDPAELRQLVRSCFEAATDTPPPPTPDRYHDPTWPLPRALVVPHAGLIYSGPVAASAYQRLLPHTVAIRRVVLLGPSHRVAFRGVAATADAWASPLGPVAIDTDVVQRVVGAGAAFFSDAAHAEEHSLEVQLPFLREVVPDALLAPFVVGDASAAQVAVLLDLVWDQPGTVVIISSDLSHYHRYDDAVRLDRHTAGEILARHPDGVSDADACGNRPLRGLLRVAEQRDLTVEVLDLRNSGDTAGDRKRVVGYGAFALT